MENGPVLIGVITTTLIVMFLVWLMRFIIGQVVSYLIPLSSQDIRGRWETCFWKGANEFKETAVLYQFLSNVWGKIEFTKGDIVRKYKVRGKMKGDIVIATYETVTPSSVYDRGAFTLAVSKDGQTLKGCYAWTDDDDTDPQCDNYVWRKKIG